MFSTFDLPQARASIVTSMATLLATLTTRSAAWEVSQGCFSIANKLDSSSTATNLIPMPTTAELTKLREQALKGQTRVVGNSAGAEGRATTRLEFVAVDINGDGDTTDDNEGFMRVYQSLGDASGADYVSGLHLVTQWSMHDATTCGTYDVPGGTFTQATNLPGSRSTHDDQLAAAAGLSCYLPASPALGCPRRLMISKGCYRPVTRPYVTASITPIARVIAGRCSR